MCYSMLMVKQLRLRQAGGSVSATLPKQMVDRMHLRAGDDVFAIDTPDGILITPYDEANAHALEAGREGARRYRNALRRLAR